MSWQSYVDDQLLATKMVSQAVICGHDGNIWAASAGFGVTAAELKNIATNFGNMDVLPMSGLTINGIRLRSHCQNICIICLLGICSCLLMTG